MRSRRGSRGGTDGSGISGELFKRRGGWGKHLPQSWHKRFFTISDGIMSYYEDNHANIVRGQLDLREEGLCVEFGVMFEYAPTQYGFQISTASFPEKWKMCAESLEDYQKWVVYIQNYLKNGNVHKLSPPLAAPTASTTKVVSSQTQVTSTEIGTPFIPVHNAHTNDITPVAGNSALEKSKQNTQMNLEEPSPLKFSWMPLYKAMSTIILLLVCISAGVTVLESSMEEFKKTTWLKSFAVSNSTVLFYSR
jgi:hypothetical protein